MTFELIDQLEQELAKPLPVDSFQRGHQFGYASALSDLRILVEQAYQNESNELASKFEG